MIARAAIAVALAACAAPARTIGTCLVWDDCGPGGACELEAHVEGGEPTEFECSFRDDACSTGRRFGDFASAGRAGRCVEPSGAFGGLCDAAHGCDGNFACRAGRCSNLATVSAGGLLATATCTSGDVFVWGNTFDLDGKPSLMDPGRFVSGLPTQLARNGPTHMCTIGEGYSECIAIDPMLLGGGMPGHLGYAVTPGGPHALVTTGARHSCGARGSSVNCWGYDDHDQLDGRGAAPPGPIDLGAPVMRVAAGGVFSCAATASAVTCWGAAANWLAGTFPTVDGSAGVVQNLGSGSITDLVAGDRHACAIIDGAVRCWGANDRGQSSGASTGVPVVATSPLPGVTALALAAGSDHTCAVTTDDEIWCWGDNAQGQLGTAGAPSGPPIQVQHPPSPTASIAAGQGFTCAALADGRVHCWGASDATPAVLEKFPLPCL